MKIIPAPVPTPVLPDLREVARRFSAACGAFDQAIVAAQERDIERHAGLLVQSARDMGSALELGARRRVGLLDPEHSPLVEGDFPQLIDWLLQRGLLKEPYVKSLKSWRHLRNRAEHHPVEVPPVDALLKALRGTRQFLVESFGEIAGLPDPNRPSATTAMPSREGQRPVEPAERDDSHRRTGPELWVSDRIGEGLRRLSPDSIESSPLTEKEVRRSLSRWAGKLAEACAPPYGSLSKANCEEGLDTPLRLYLEAGWLIEDPTAGSVRFSDPRLAALLVGLGIAKQGKSASAKRTALGNLRAWAETAWAATAAGDLAHDWLRPFLDDGAAESLPDRVVTACAAMAGLVAPYDRSAVDLVRRAAPAAVAALVWLVPLRAPQFRSGAPEAWEAWRFERDDWQRAVLDLAKATRELPSPPEVVDWRQPGGALGRLVTALGLEPRASDDVGRAVVLLGCPWPREGVSPLDEPFFRTLFSNGDGIGRHVGETFIPSWMAEVGVSALRRGDLRRAARMLVVPGAGGPAGFLLNKTALHPDWCEAWSCFAEHEPVEETAAAWVEGATWIAQSREFDDQVMVFMLQRAPERLRELGAWEVARAHLEGKLSPGLLPTRPDERQHMYGSYLLALAELSPEVWRRKILEWSAEPQLPWGILVDAGAPHDAVARWCVDKLRQKARDAPNQSEPIGIVAEGAEVVSHGRWQLAFEEAREALGWLLEHGDEAAVGVLAEACFARDESERCNPIMGKYIAGLVIPLSQILWGRAIRRPGGRAAFFARIERGEETGSDLHFLPDAPLPAADEGLWQRVISNVALPLVQERRDPTDEEIADRRQLLLPVDDNYFCRSSPSPSSRSSHSLHARSPSRPTR